MASEDPGVGFRLMMIVSGEDRGYLPFSEELDGVRPSASAFLGNSRVKGDGEVGVFKGRSSTKLMIQFATVFVKTSTGLVFAV